MRLWCVVLWVLIFSTRGLAQWPVDPTVNLPIADRASEQVIPKVAATSDGGCYVGWFDLASGNYDVYLQRLDSQGNELWAHNGILVSGNPQNSFLVDWDLCVDSDDHCVLVFSDDRNGGGDFDVYAYRIAPDGTFVWGANGVTISEDPGFEAAPRIVELTTGDFVVVWSRDSNGKIMGQSIAPDGTLLFAAGGIELGGLPGETPAFVEIVPSDSGSFIATWVRDISTFFSERHIRAQKFSAAGDRLWGPNSVSIYDASSVPIAHVPRIVSDHNGGAVIAWHSAPTTIFNAHVQRLNSDGVELFAHNGVTVSTSTSRNHLDPSLLFDSADEVIYTFVNERNGGQSQWGIYGQKFDAAGARQWGDEGLEMIPVSPVLVGSPRSVLGPSGPMIFLIEQPTGVFGQDRVIGMSFDSDGTPLWTGQPIEVAALLSGKARLPVAATPSGGAIAIWEDERIDASDVYGQRVAPDGSLGPQLATGPTFDRGDCNADDAFDISDAIAALTALFGGGDPSCGDACDANDDGGFDIADAVFTLTSLFVPGSPSPAAPHGFCGEDPTADSLDCGAFDSCP